MAFRRRSKKRGGPALTYIRRERKFHIGMIYDVLTWVAIVIVSVFLGLVVVYAFGTRTSVVGPSMEPTLRSGQEILINKIAYQLSAPKCGDVVVFKPNGNENAHVSVKRVIGVPGDTIQIESGKVLINGKLYTKDMAETTDDPGLAAEPITLGADEYFVLGDNRRNSEDSRSANIGNISRSMIDGKAYMKLEIGDQETEFIR